MNFFSKLLIVVLSVFALIFIKDTFFENKNVEIQTKFKKIERFEYKKQAKKIENKQTKTQEVKQQTSQKVAPKASVIAIYFTNTKDGELRPIYKTLPEGQAKINFAVKTLIAGPSIKEINQGYSSEIPKGTKLLGLRTNGSSYIIDISDDFQYGGGTESQYLRLKQLIKTIVSLKPDKPVYLYLNAKKAEVIGGEGIQITQPLSEKSLNE